MTNFLNADLREATRLTTAGLLTEAAAALRRMLGRGETQDMAAPAARASAARPTPPTLEGVAESAESMQAVPAARPASQRAEEPGLRLAPAAHGTRRLPFQLSAGAGQAWPDALRGLLDQKDLSFTSQEPSRHAHE